MFPMVFHDYIHCRIKPCHRANCCLEAQNPAVPQQKGIALTQYTATPLCLTNLQKNLECGTCLTARNHMAYALNHDICGEFNYV